MAEKIDKFRVSDISGVRLVPDGCVHFSYLWNTKWNGMDNYETWLSVDLTAAEASKQIKAALRGTDKDFVVSAMNEAFGDKWHQLKEEMDLTTNE